MNAHLFAGNVQAGAQSPLLGLSEEYSHFRYKVNFMSSESLITLIFFPPFSFLGDCLYILYIEEITEM